MDDDQDNTESAVSEELSRFSSPTGSQSSSCTSISNPFYDGPSSSNNDSGFNPHNGTQHRNSLKRSFCVHNIPDKSFGASRPSNREQIGGPSSDQNVYRVLTPSSSGLSRDEKIASKVIITWDPGYLITCFGFLQFLQFVSIKPTILLIF